MLIVTMIVFVSLRVIPGDAVDLMLSQRWWRGDRFEEDPREVLRRELGLDVPIHIQYGRWMSGIVKGDLGKSLWTSIPVTRNILQRLPVSLELGLLAIVASLVIALPVGIYSGMRPETKIDQLFRSFAILCICVPHFWLGTMILVYPAIWWGALMVVIGVIYFIANKNKVVE